MGVRGVVVLAVVACWSVRAAAAELAPIETVVDSHDDYLAIAFEAEDHVEADERWVLTEPTTPAQENDPDGNHSDQAVGSAYLELLPDWRVTHESIIPDDAPPWIWGRPHDSPRALYPIDFPEAGRYHVHARMLSTGTEDNALHIGLDGGWPESGRRLQTCSANRGWSWTSKQRDSGGNACGIPKTIWLTVEEPGVHTVAVGAREDGVELDRVMLIKDRSANTRVCSPSGADAVRCRDGSIETSDGFVDLGVSLESEREEGSVGERFTLLATVRNTDLFDTATEVELDVAVDPESWAVVDLDARCESVESRVSCELEPIDPSGSEEGERVSLELEAIAAGLLGLEASVRAAESDDGPEDDVAYLDIDIEAPPLPAILAVELDGLPGSIELGERTSVSLSVTNDGETTAAETRVAFSIPAEFAVVGESAGCVPTEEGGRACQAPALEPGQTVDLALSLEAVALGQVSVGASAEADGAEGAAVVRSVLIVEPAVTVDERSGDPEDGGADVTDEADAEESDGARGTSSGGGGALTPPFASLLALLALVLVPRRRARRAVDPGTLA